MATSRKLSEEWSRCGTTEHRRQRLAERLATGDESPITTLIAGPRNLRPFMGENLLVALDSRVPARPGPRRLLRQLPPLAEIASSTLGGDMGSSVIRMPMARLTALPTAASGATMGVSPQPRTP